MSRIGACGYCGEVAVEGDGHAVDYCPQLRYEFDNGLVCETISADELSKYLGLDDA